MNLEINTFLGLGDHDPSDKELLYEKIKKRVDYYLLHQPDLLMSYLYRLDVLEVDIQAVLKSSEDVAAGLARLIYERQLLRLKTKQQYKQDPIEGWEY